MLSLQSFLREGRVVGPSWEKLKPKGPKGPKGSDEQSCGRGPSVGELCPGISPISFPALHAVSIFACVVAAATWTRKGSVTLHPRSAPKLAYPLAFSIKLD